MKVSKVALEERTKGKLIQCQQVVYSPENKTRGKTKQTHFYHFAVNYYTDFTNFLSLKPIQNVNLIKHDLKITYKTEIYEHGFKRSSGVITSAD